MLPLNLPPVSGSLHFIIIILLQSGSAGPRLCVLARAIKVQLNMMNLFFFYYSLFISAGFIIESSVSLPLISPF